MKLNKLDNQLMHVTLLQTLMQGDDPETLKFDPSNKETRIVFNGEVSRHCLGNTLLPAPEQASTLLKLFRELRQYLKKKFTANLTTAGIFLAM